MNRLKKAAAVLAALIVLIPVISVYGECDEERPGALPDRLSQSAVYDEKEDTSEEERPGDGIYTTLDELKHARIGVQTGTSFDTLLEEMMPEAEKQYFNGKADLINALKSRKIDCFVIDEPIMKVWMKEDADLTYVPEFLEYVDFGVVFQKSDAGKKLQSEFNAFLAKAKSEGYDEELRVKWFESDPGTAEGEDYKSLPAVNGVLRMATEATYEPFEFMSEKGIQGLDIDLVSSFCREYGYGLDITDTTFDAILPGVQSGKYDLSACGLTITAERAESVYFSDPYFSSGTVLVVLKAEGSAKKGFFAGLSDSFQKTFIREQRWKLFLQGIGNTLLITILSVLLGTALGFALFMLCRNGNKAANRITGFCTWLVQGMPMVVLLMILYYVVFGKLPVTGIFVAVVGFTLTFGAAVLGMLRMGVGAVDNGQYEAAYALGYTNRRTFYRIILPQALPHIMPAFRSEIIGLIKATAIVGYITVRDLTKIGDLIRSRTYEAFFPLIAVTVIYFVLEGLLGILVDLTEKYSDPRKRSRDSVLKGVKRNDQD